MSIPAGGSTRTGCRGHSEPSLAVVGDQAHDVTHEAYLAMALVRALVAIPPVATGGIGTGAAIAAVLVAPAGKP